MTVPSREMLQEEFVESYMNVNKVSNNLSLSECKLITACKMSEKYQIDISKFMWTIAGIKRGKYENALNVLNQNGITHYTAI